MKLLCAGRMLSVVESPGLYQLHMLHSPNGEQVIETTAFITRDHKVALGARIGIALKGARTLNENGIPMQVIQVRN